MLTFISLLLLKAFNIWGMAVNHDLKDMDYKVLLGDGRKVTLEEAIFRSPQAFRPSTLKEYLHFWEEEILKEHPDKVNILKWLAGVRIEDFLQSFTEGKYQGIPMHSYYPEPQEFSNYVPPQFEDFIDKTVSEWESLGMLRKWDEVRKPGDPPIPTVVSPLGVEPSKPRALWDGRYVNEFCRDFPFAMDNAPKVAEVAWGGVYFFKIDHKNGYQHVPIHEDSWKYFGVFWKGIYYVFAVLPFGWKSSPFIYHTITEAVAMYCRSLGIPMVVWIDDMLGMSEQKYRGKPDEELFQSALRAMVVVSIVLFKAGYFLGLPKCKLVPEKVMTYLGIECDSLKSRFSVPEDRVMKYVALLQELVERKYISFAEMEKVVGKLVSLECAVPAGMWYTRFQYATMRESGVSSDSSKSLKNRVLLLVTEELLQEWNMWIYFLKLNTGSAWKTLETVFIQADISSDASGRTFAGVVSRKNYPDKVVAGEFWGAMLAEDIQVKEGEALRQTLNMMVQELPEEIKGTTLVCKVDNQSLKAVMERKGSTRVLALNHIGKQIYWMQQLGEFALRLEYVRSEDNVADPFTRQSPGLETSLSDTYFWKIWNQLGPFDWDLMATSANVNKTPQGAPLLFYSRYFDAKSKGVNLFSQVLQQSSSPFCFPPEPIISMVLRYLRVQRKSCVVLVPAINALWVNLLREYAVDSLLVSKPFDNRAFTITHPTGKRVPKLFHHAMIAVKLEF